MEVGGGLELGFRWVSSLNHVIKGYVMRRKCITTLNFKRMCRQLLLYYFHNYGSLIFISFSLISFIYLLLIFFNFIIY